MFAVALNLNIGITQAKDNGGLGQDGRNEHGKILVYFEVINNRLCGICLEW